MIAAVLWFFGGSAVGTIAVTLINMSLSNAALGIALPLRVISKPARSLRLAFGFCSIFALFAVLAWNAIRVSLFFWDAHAGFRWGFILASIIPAIGCFSNLVGIPTIIATATDKEMEDGDVKGEISVKAAFALYGVALLIFVFANSFYVENVEVTPEAQEHAKMLTEIISDPEKMVNYGKMHIALGDIDEGVAILEEAGRLFPESEVVENAIRQVREDFGK